MAAFPATGGHAPSRRRPGTRSAGWTSDKRRAFLAALSSCLNVRRAVDMVGLTYSAAYQLKRRDPDFARAWAEALDEGYANLELELLRQAIEGCERKETVREGENGPVRSVKITHTHPHELAKWLLQSHRDEVMGYRQEQQDGGMLARVDAQLDMVRMRLIGGADVSAEPVSGGNEESQQQKIGSGDEQDRSD